MPFVTESDCVTTLSPEILKRAKEELGEDDNLRASSITAIRQWLKNQPHLQSACTDAVFLLAFLRTCKYSLEDTKRKLDSFMTLKSALPEFYGQWDPIESNNQTVFNYGTYLPLPGYDPIGGKVIVYRPGAYDPYNISFDHLMKVSGMIGRVLIEEEEQMYTTGQVVIMDMKGYSLAHFTQWFSKSAKLISVSEGMYPSRPKHIIFINTPTIFQKFYKWGINLMKEKMKRRVIVCAGNGNYESLHKHVSKSFLPKDYGGDGVSLAELTSYWKKKAEENRDFLMREERINIVDESKRAGRPKTSRELFGILGSFRKLNVD